MNFELFLQALRQLCIEHGVSIHADGGIIVVYDAHNDEEPILCAVQPWSSFEDEEER